MKLILISVAFMIGVAALLGQRYVEPSCRSGSISPVFSPADSEVLFKLIEGAKQEIDVEVYEFSYKQLADALIEASKRNVSIRVIIEPSVYQNGAIFRYLVNSGIEVAWAKGFQITHSKFMVVDGTIVLVGSLNWSESSLKYNREASVIIYSKEVSEDFERVFDSDFARSSSS